MTVSTWWAVAVWRGSVVSKLPLISFVSYSPWENMVFNRAFSLLIRLDRRLKPLCPPSSFVIEAQEKLQIDHRLDRSSLIIFTVKHCKFSQLSPSVKDCTFMKQPLSVRTKP